MGKQRGSLGLALGVIFLASCAKSGLENQVAAPPAEPAEEQLAAQDIVVTGSRAARANLESASPVAIMGMPAPPPPPPAPGMAPDYWNPIYQDVGRDKFTSFAENAFKVVREVPVSTFSIDVDTASYSWVRASLNQNLLPQPAAVRTEEMVNYFHYDYAAPRSASQPFASNVAVFPSPWTAGRKLVRIGIKGYSIRQESRPR